jgi:hypothetical protein
MISNISIRSRWSILCTPLAILAAILFASTPVPASSGTPLDLTGYQQTFSDDFLTLSASAYGPGTRWIAHTPWNGDFGAAVFDNPGPHSPFSTGAEGLVITAHRDSKGRWHSGLLCSRDRDGPGAEGFAQEYGYFEMKAELPSGSGTWPAFWLIGINKKPAAAEIDVVEYYGGFSGYYHSVEHIWQNGADRLHLDHLTQVPDGQLADRYNTYGVLITPSLTTFYFNRHEIWSTATQPEFRQPMYLLVNLAIGGGWPSKTLPSPISMHVAYIKVFQKTP